MEEMKGLALTHTIMPFKPEAAALCGQLEELLSVETVLRLRKIKSITVRREGKPEVRLGHSQGEVEHVSYRDTELDVEVVSRRRITLTTNEKRLEMMASRDHYAHCAGLSRD
jgi:malonyl CoA-acyl carrier protein transacylase